MFRDWYLNHFSQMTGHGLWFRGGEINTLPLEEYERRPFRAMFVRLSTYFDTGYSFTHQFLYQVAANTSGVFPDLGYLPPKQDAVLFAQGGVPWLVGTQTKRGPKDFDLIGFSNSIVQELINIPSFLRLSGVPLAKSERLADADLPLVVVGGANALYSSAVWGGAGVEPLVDAVFVGESDVAIRRLLEICRDGKAAGKTKATILDELEEVPGFFQPDKPRSTKKSFVPNLNLSESLETGPVYYLEDQLGNSHLQISEGCPCFCSFCAESWDRKPYRERRSAELLKTAMKAKASMGLDHIDIYSFNFNMHSDLYQILWELVPHFKGIGLKSQRFDLLAHDTMMVEFQHAIEKASFTCGLEGISPRLRKYLHKNIENEQLHKSLTAIFKSKARELKIFMIATGLEEEQDFTALTDLLDHLREIMQACHSSTRIIFSMTPLVRFPWTPLEFEDAHSVARYSRIINEAARRIKAAGFEFRESADLPEYWVSQILVRAAAPAVSRALLKALDDTGFVYYREVPESFMRALEVSLVAEGLDPAALLRGFTLEQSRGKPWAAIETGVKREFLWEEVQRARLYTEIDYCLGRNWRAAKCFHCGGCPTRWHVRDIVLARQERKYQLADFKARVKAARDADVPVSFLVEIGEPARGVPRKMAGVALARALMLASPELTPFYRGFKGALFADEDNPVWTGGSDVLTLIFNRQAMPVLEQALAEKLAFINEKFGDWGRLAGFAPSNWRPSAVVFDARFRPKIDEYLKARGLKYTLKRSGSGYAYELTPQAVKKGIVASISTAMKTDGGTAVTITPGPKFSVREFAREAFAFGDKKNDWVKVRATVLRR